MLTKQEEVASQRIREALEDIKKGRVFTVEAGLKELRQLRKRDSE